jgi:hypothetical protein
MEPIVDVGTLSASCVARDHRDAIASGSRVCSTVRCRIAIGLAVRRQSEDLDEDVMADPQFTSLILLLVVPPEAVGPREASYCVETALQSIREDSLSGLLPFADDTGGNLWALDARTHPEDPAIILIDHELMGGDAVFPVAPNFDAFMAIIEAGS